MSDPTPLVSVITPAYNAQAFIGETLRSVLAQSFTDFEYLVVDDWSEPLGALVQNESPPVA